MSHQLLKKLLWLTSGFVLYLLGIGVCCAAAGDPASGVGIQVVANQVKSNFTAIAQFITAGSYLAGMAFGVGAIVKFKAHKDNPTQVAISVPIALLFIAAALLFIPSVFKSTGQTLFGVSGTVGGVSGVYSFNTSK